ncbi:MAG TPA: hypothetical protein VIC62_13770, partial [Nakamurella sp.]
MRTSRIATALVATASVLLLAGCGTGETSASTTTTPAATSAAASSPAVSVSASPSARASGSVSSAASPAGETTAEMEQYCERSGGQVQTRSPYWNTNGDQAQWLALGGSATMCRFQAADEARSRIYLDLTTLSSPEPTLAGLAYLSKVPMPSSAGGANPATGYCSNQLHGSSTFGGGAGAAGGGWVAPDDPDDVVVSLCVFPDGSYIDEWGLAYHSAGEVRGQDLTTVIRSQPSGALPPVFPVAPVKPTS